MFFELVFIKNEIVQNILLVLQFVQSIKNIL